MRGLKGLLALARGDVEQASTADITPSLPQAEAELASAREAQDEAERLYRASLLTQDDTTIRRYDDGRRETAIRVDRAIALVTGLRERLAEAATREAEFARVERYEAARRKLEEGRDALSLYTQAAEDLVSILTVIAEAEAAVVAANGDLPQGAERLPAVEGPIRDRPAAPEEVLSEVTVEHWVEVGFTHPGQFDQRAVLVTGDRRGVIKVAGVPVNECRQVELRRFTDRRVVHGTPGKPAQRLIEQIALPNFTDDAPPIARPAERPYQRTITPDVALDHLRRIATAREAAQAAAVRSQKSLVRGPVVSELRAEPGADRVRAERRPPATRLEVIEAEKEIGHRYSSHGG